MQHGSLAVTSTRAGNASTIHHIQRLPPKLHHSCRHTAARPFSLHHVFQWTRDEIMQFTFLRHPFYSVLTQSFDQALPSKENQPRKPPSALPRIYSHCPELNLSPPLGSSRAPPESSFCPSSQSLRLVSIVHFL